MNKVLIILLLILIIPSCGKEIGDLAPIDVTGSYLKNPNSFTEQELELASVVCRALRSKRITFPVEFLGELYQLETTHTDCNSETTASKFTGSLAINEEGKMIIDSSHKGHYHKEVYTDESGPLRYFCPSILNGKQISNSINLDSFGKKMMRAAFKKGEGIPSDKAIFTVFEVPKSGDEKPIETYRLSVLTHPSSKKDHDYKGLVTEVYSEQKCSENPDKVEVFLQRIRKLGQWPQD